MKPETEILLSAAFVLTPEENWCRFAYATDEDGNEMTLAAVTLANPRVARMCVVAAIVAAGNDYSPGYARRAHLLFTKATGPSYSGEGFNNTHTHAEVIDALYKAAELAEQS